MRLNQFEIGFSAWLQRLGPRPKILDAGPYSTMTDFKISQMGLNIPIDHPSPAYQLIACLGPASLPRFGANNLAGGGKRLGMFSPEPVLRI